MHACIHCRYILRTTVEQSAGHQPTASQLRIHSFSNSLAFSNTPIYIYTSVSGENAVLEHWSTMLSGSLLEHG
jgi:hypothetical protein